MWIRATRSVPGLFSSQPQFVTRMAPSSFFARVRHGVAVAVVAALLSAEAASDQTWQVKTALTVKETYDDNVYLQNVTALAGRSSLVSSGGVNLGVTYQTRPEFKAVFSYAPEVVVFHREKSEGHIDNRFALSAGGKTAGWTWDVQNSLFSIEGESEGPNFLPGGAIPAIGAAPLRDRRDGDVYRHGLKATHARDAWFFRPQFAVYVHDFRTEQHAATGAYAGYENYIDRSEVSGGFDVGYKAFPGASLVAGYRYGQQRQQKLLGVRSPYANNYQRFLVGVEGTLAPWLKAAVLIGPDLRDFRDNPPPAFHRSEVIYFVDGLLTFTPSKTDTVVVTLRRFEQPAFASHSMYEDITYDVIWRRQWSGKLTSTLGFKAYGGDWQGPGNREDWIYTSSVAVVYGWSDNVATELGYTHDIAKSEVLNTSAREYTRRLFSAGIKYTF
jgi:hypothetical protein